MKRVLKDTFVSAAIVAWWSFLLTQCGCKSVTLQGHILKGLFLLGLISSLAVVAVLVVEGLVHAVHVSRGLTSPNGSRLARDPTRKAVSQGEGLAQ